MKIGIGPIWVEAQPFKKWRERRAAKREAQLTSELLPEEGGEEKTMLNGKLTYTGIAVLAISWLAERFGLPAAPEEIESVVTTLAAVVGTLVAIYGRYRASRAKP
jgi:hypothetical protein